MSESRSVWHTRNFSGWAIVGDTDLACHAHVYWLCTAQALRAAHNRSLDVLAEAEARLKDEAAAKAVRDAKAQQVR